MTDTELLQALYNDMQTVKHKVTSLDEKVASLDEKVASLDEKVASLDEKVASLDEKVASLECEVSKINVTLENETNRNIKIIAEGHLDLSRKLNEAVRLSSDIKAKQEIQDIYINMHQNQLRAL
ncbi:hypothetical protein E5329_09265 [Petralouisia muris]|uniref:Uncharacterized protein n=1 Tax=Petralouisia muris TaxID=3032872 RepID=A0AC61RX28_9FIRM|nr:hypothetical protein [Petralouisia muris]TGY96555.1 hypothetical protein E5329_09265 [Petralouisia muris]